MLDLNKTCETTDNLGNGFKVAIKRVEKEKGWLLWTYFAAFIMAAFVFLTPWPDPWARFGANLILFPTMVTGIHVFLLNRSSSVLAPANAKLASGFSCENCTQWGEETGASLSLISEQLRKVIIIETVFATVGTALWAYGDLLGNGV